MKFKTLSSGAAVVTVLAACQPLGSTVVEGLQGKEAHAANVELKSRAYRHTDCETLVLQEKSMRPVIKNPFHNIAGGAIYLNDYKALLLAMERKGCTS